MSASLVGSEMCIRDSPCPDATYSRSLQEGRLGSGVRRTSWIVGCPVSYTHLTLPTICSV
eukprot:6540704-Alexandrium_andersonii.AAC.1